MRDSISIWPHKISKYFKASVINLQPQERVIFHIEYSIYYLWVFSSFAFWLAQDLTFTLWTTTTHKHISVSAKGFLVLTSSILTYGILLDSRLLLPFSCRFTVLFCLCRWQTDHSFSIWSWHCGYSWLESSVKGNSEEDLISASLYRSCPPPVFYPNLLFFFDLIHMCQFSKILGLGVTLLPE